jgi:hypothetical protein
MPFSGAAPDWTGDLEVDSWAIEVKARARGFLRLRWQDSHGGLILAADCRGPWVLLRPATLLREFKQTRRAQETRPKTSRRPSGAISRPR